MHSEFVCTPSTLTFRGPLAIAPSIAVHCALARPSCRRSLEGMNRRSSATTSALARAVSLISSTCRSVASSCICMIVLCISPRTLPPCDIVQRYVWVGFGASRLSAAAGEATDSRRTFSSTGRAKTTVRQSTFGGACESGHDRDDRYPWVGTVGHRSHHLQM
jgi:hypothetical protein